MTAPDPQWHLEQAAQILTALHTHPQRIDTITARAAWAEAHVHLARELRVRATAAAYDRRREDNATTVDAVHRIAAAASKSQTKENDDD